MRGMQFRSSFKRLQGNRKNFSAQLFLFCIAYFCICYFIAFDLVIVCKGSVKDSSQISLEISFTNVISPDQKITKDLNLTLRFKKLCDPGKFHLPKLQFSLQVNNEGSRTASKDFILVSLIYTLNNRCLSSGLFNCFFFVLPKKPVKINKIEVNNTFLVVKKLSLEMTIRLILTRGIIFITFSLHGELTAFVEGTVSLT